MIEQLFRHRYTCNHCNKILICESNLPKGKLPDGWVTVIYRGDPNWSQLSLCSLTGLEKTWNTHYCAICYKLNKEALKLIIEN